MAKIIVYATKEAREKYEGKMASKKIKVDCPSCNIKKDTNLKETNNENNGE